MFILSIALGIIIIALLITGVFFYRRFSCRTATLIAELNETNAGYIEVIQEREHQEFLMATIDDITFSLLRMPDNDAEQFNNYLYKGMQTISMCGQIDAIKVYRNMMAEGGDRQFEAQLSWTGGIRDIDGPPEAYSYASFPGRYEKLVKLEMINITAEKLLEAEKKIVSDKAKSVLIVPVFFQERFWGTVWYEDYNSDEDFAERRVALLHSAALMLVSAVHRKRQARRIYEATHRMRLMLDAMPICCFIWDKNAQIVDVNAMGVRFFNFINREELTARFDEASPEFQPDGQRSYEAHIKNLKIALEKGEYNFEWVHRIPDTGELVPVEVSFIKINYDGRHVVAAYVRDVREQRRMIAEIEHRGHLLYTVNAASNVLLQSDTEEFETALFRSLSMMARAVDVERIFVWEYMHHSTRRQFNQIYEWIGDATVFQRQSTPVFFENDTVGFESRLLRGLFLAGLSANLPEESRKSLNLTNTKSYLIIPIFLRSKLWGVVGFGDMRRERGFSESDESILRNGGLLLANALLRNEMTHNIKENAKKLSEALEETQSASRAKSNFLSTMSHEMRTPLNAIMGMSTLGRGAKDIERKDYAFDKINAASSHLLGVISDVLDMSKIEAGMLTLSEEVFELDRVMENVITVNQFRIDEKNQIFNINIAHDVPKVIVADDHRLAQVLTNLLSNANKFTENGKQIEMDVSLASSTETSCVLRFDVRDEGIGLSEEQQSKLFHSFVQAEDSTTRKFGGTGLGLAISKHIVELMGGMIWVKSKPGEGATFSFTMKAGLPTIEILHEIAVEENTPDGPLFFPGRRLLIVEDVEINREILIAMLEETGVEITCAENGEQAMQIFDADPDFDLIFMDVHMPVMDGYQATEKIRALNVPQAKTVPIVAMTANVFKEDIEKCLESGMDAHIGKPLDFGAVRDSLRRFLY